MEILSEKREMDILWDHWLSCQNKSLEESRVNGLLNKSRRTGLIKADDVLLFFMPKENILIDINISDLVNFVMRKWGSFFMITYYFNDVYCRFNQLTVRIRLKVYVGSLRWEE